MNPSRFSELESLLERGRGRHEWFPNSLLQTIATVTKVKFCLNVRESLCCPHPGKLGKNTSLSHVGRQRAWRLWSPSKCSSTTGSKSHCLGGFELPSSLRCLSPASTVLQSLLIMLSSCIQITMLTLSVIIVSLWLYRAPLTPSYLLNSL